VTGFRKKDIRKERKGKKMNERERKGKARQRVKRKKKQRVKANYYWHKITNWNNWNKISMIESF
jgi:hypothetical protein